MSISHYSKRRMSVENIFINEIYLKIKPHLDKIKKCAEQIDDNLNNEHLDFYLEIIQYCAHQLLTVIDESIGSYKISYGFLNENNKKYINVEYLNALSHEIRTPVNGILGFSEIVIGASSLENKSTHTYIISNSVNRLIRAVNSIFEYSKLICN